MGTYSKREIVITLESNIDKILKSNKGKKYIKKLNNFTNIALGRHGNEYYYTVTEKITAHSILFFKEV